MAQVLDQFRPFDRTAPVKYRWHEWLDGRPWRLTQGVDFACSRMTMKSNIHLAARKRGLDVVTKMSGEDAIEFQVIGTF